MRIQPDEIVYYLRELIDAVSDLQAKTEKEVAGLKAANDSLHSDLQAVEEELALTQARLEECNTGLEKRDEGATQ